MLFKGVEIENGDELQPGNFYYLVPVDARVVQKRDGSQYKQPRVRATLKKSPDAHGRIRVYRDRSGRRRTEAARWGE